MTVFHRNETREPLPEALRGGLPLDPLPGRGRSVVPMTTTPATATALVHTYFTAAVAADQEPYVALFAPDATVEDEGRSFTGRQAVREWRRDVPDVTYAPGEVVADADGWAVRATVAGDFPGSPVELGYWFCFDDQDLVAQLRIRP